MKKLFRLSILLGLLMCPMVLKAWGPQGHRIIASVAYDYLSKKARKQVDQILGVRGMIYYSTWPDEIKSDTIYPHSFVWHFQDLDSGMTDSALVATLTDYPEQGGRLWFALDSLTDALRNNPKDDVTLRFVVHLLGDRFCPMHIAHMEDKGGNKVKMNWFNTPVNLHKVWDECIIDYYNYSYQEYAQMLRDKYGDSRTSVERQSREDELRHTYDMTERIYQYQQTWSGSAYKYAYDWQNEMNGQLYAAGVKLAVLLNSIYK